MPRKPSEIVAMRRIEAAVEHAKKMLRKLKRRKAEWQHKDARLEYVRDYKRKVREARLQRLVPSRHCPVCGGLKTSNRQWAIHGRKDLEGVEDESVRLTLWEACGVVRVSKKVKDPIWDGRRRRKVDVHCVALCRGCAAKHVWPSRVGERRPPVNEWKRAREVSEEERGE